MEIELKEARYPISNHLVIDTLLKEVDLKSEPDLQAFDNCTCSLKRCRKFIKMKEEIDLNNNNVESK